MEINSAISTLHVGLFDKDVVIVGSDVTKRLLGTRDFLKEVGKQGGFRKDIAAFHLRWISGRGCPRITAAFTFHK